MYVVNILSILRELGQGENIDDKVGLCSRREWLQEPRALLIDGSLAIFTSLVHRSGQKLGAKPLSHLFLFYLFLSASLLLLSPFALRVHSRPPPPPPAPLCRAPSAKERRDLSKAAQGVCKREAKKTWGSEGQERKGEGSRERTARRPKPH